MKWIDVKNIKPELDKKVFLFNGEIEVGMLTKNEDSEEIWSDQPYEHGSPHTQFSNVTHWRPLFKKPKTK